MHQRSEYDLPELFVPPPGLEIYRHPERLLPEIPIGEAPERTYEDLHLRPSSASKETKKPTRNGSYGKRRFFNHRSLWIVIVIILLIATLSGGLGGTLGRRSG